MEELEKIREKIDVIDEKLLVLLNKRAKFALEIAKIKKDNLKDIRVVKREKEIYKHIKSMNIGPLLDSSLERIWNEIILSSIALEKKTNKAIEEK